MKIYNFDNSKLLEEVENYEKFEDKLRGVAPVAYADAVKRKEKRDKTIRDMMANHFKDELKDLDNTEQAREKHKKVEATPELKKMHLAESVDFGDDDDVNTLWNKVYASITADGEQYEIPGKIGRRRNLGLYEVEDVSTDANGNIVVYASNLEALNPAVDVADKFGLDYNIKKDKYLKHKNIYVTIIIPEERANEIVTEDLDSYKDLLDSAEEAIEDVQYDDEIEFGSDFDKEMTSAINAIEDEKERIRK